MKPSRKLAPVVAAAPAPPEAPTAPGDDPEDIAGTSAWADSSTAVLCLVTDVSVLPAGFPPESEPPPFVTVGPVADLDQASVVAAIVAAFGLDEEEDETEEGPEDSGEAGVFVLVWGDPSKAENLTVIPEDPGGDETEPEPAPEAPDEPMMAAAATLGATGGSVSDKPWDGSAGRFTDEQYQRAAAACDPASKGTIKSRCFLPHHEPGGAVNRNGVHAAAQRVGSLSGRSPDAVAKAKGHLHRHYTTDLKEDPPDSVLSVVTAGAAPPLNGIPTPLPVPEWEALIVTEGEPTDDGRTVAPGALSWRPLPLSFTFQPIDSPDAHDDAPVGGAITEIARDGNMVMARGIYAQGPLGETCRAMVDDPGMPLAPSIRMADDSMTAQVMVGPDGQHLTVLDGLLLNFCIVPVEAQASTWIRNLPLSGVMPDMPMSDLPMMAGAFTACGEGMFGAPLYPPRDWLYKRAPGDGTFIGPTVTDEGQVFGHCAGGTCHIGIPGTCKRITDANLSRDFDKVFHKGLDGQGRGIKTAEGDMVLTGQISFVGGHPDMALSAAAARAAYDDTRSVFANVRVSWDASVGAPWMAGAVSHTATEGQVQTFRACGEVSVDYRYLPDGERGKAYLIHLLAVPRGGLPPMKALLAGGELQTAILSASRMEATGSATWPIADRDLTFQDEEVEPRIRKWASTDGSGDLDKLDWSKYRSVHFWWDPKNPEQEQSYKMKFCDVVNGQVQAVPRGIFVAAGEMQGARRGVDIPDSDREAVRGRIAGYYRRMAEKFKDPSLVVPWEKSSAAASAWLLAAAAEGMAGLVLAESWEEEAHKLAASMGIA